MKSAANTSWPAANIQKQGKRTNATGNRLTQAVKALSVSHASPVILLWLLTPITKATIYSPQGECARIEYNNIDLIVISCSKRS